MTESRRERYIRLLNSKSDLDIVGITHDAVRELIEVLEEPERKWIPCSERLPDTDRDVLACDEYDVFVGYYVDEMIGWHDQHSYKRYPTAWQEKPEPYKGGTE